MHSSSIRTYTLALLLCLGHAAVVCLASSGSGQAPNHGNVAHANQPSTTQPSANQPSANQPSANQLPLGQTPTTQPPSPTTPPPPTTPPSTQPPAGQPSNANVNHAGSSTIASSAQGPLPASNVPAKSTPQKGSGQTPTTQPPSPTTPPPPTTPPAGQPNNANVNHAGSSTIASSAQGPLPASNAPAKSTPQKGSGHGPLPTTGAPAKPPATAVVTESRATAAGATTVTHTTTGHLSSITPGSGAASGGGSIAVVTGAGIGVGAVFILATVALIRYNQKRSSNTVQRRQSKLSVSSITGKLSGGIAAVTGNRYVTPSISKSRDIEYEQYEAVCPDTKGQSALPNYNVNVRQSSGGYDFAEGTDESMMRSPSQLNRELESTSEYTLDPVTAVVSAKNSSGELMYHVLGTHADVGDTDKCHESYSNSQLQGIQKVLNDPEVYAVYSKTAGSTAGALEPNPASVRCLSEASIEGEGVYEEGYGPLPSSIKSTISSNGYKNTRASVTTTYTEAENDYSIYSKSPSAVNPQVSGLVDSVGFEESTENVRAMSRFYTKPRTGRSESTASTTALTYDL